MPPGPSSPFSDTYLASLRNISTSRWGPTSLAESFEKSLHHKMLFSAAFFYCLLSVLCLPVLAPAPCSCTLVSRAGENFGLSASSLPHPLCRQTRSSVRGKRRNARCRENCGRPEQGGLEWQRREALATLLPTEGQIKAQGDPEPCCRAHC